MNCPFKNKSNFYMRWNEFKCFEWIIVSWNWNDLLYLLHQITYYIRKMARGTPFKRVNVFGRYAKQFMMSYNYTIFIFPIITLWCDCCRPTPEVVNLDFTNSLLFQFPVPMICSVARGFLFMAYDLSNRLHF